MRGLNHLDFQQEYDLSEGLSVSSVSALSRARPIPMGIPQDLDQMKRSCPCGDASDCLTLSLFLQPAVIAVLQPVLVFFSALSLSMESSVGIAFPPHL